MLQQGGIQAGEDEDEGDQAISTFASRIAVLSFCTRTLMSAGPARSGCGEAKTVMSRSLTV